VSRDKTIKVEKVGPARKKENGSTEQDVLEVSVYFEKGGPNYFHGGTTKRGYYVSVSPKTLESKEGEPTWERTRLGCGFKFLLREASRFSAKTLDEQAEIAAVSTELQERLKKLTLADPLGAFAPH